MFCGHILARLGQKSRVRVLAKLFQKGQSGPIRLALELVN